MYAFAWIDKRENLFLARDRFGEKPLFYFEDDDGSIFYASEIKYIFALLGKKLPINYIHLKNTLLMDISLYIKLRIRSLLILSN